MKSIAAIATSAALIAGMSIGAPAQASADNPVASAKAGPLSPGLKEVANGTEVSPAGDATADLARRPDGRVVAEVRLANTRRASLGRLRATGATILSVSKAQRSVTVAIDPADLDALAALTPLVESAVEVLPPATNAACPSGPFVSEGVAQLRADLARATFGMTGQNIKVGVLSDSYNRLSGAGADVSNGELPGVSNPCGHVTAVSNLAEGPSGADEGRAMAQIVHDVAPGAKLLFATAFVSEADFAQKIRDLAAAGASIIVDDITYFAEPMYQDGLIAKAVADVTAQGVAYFSSAANSNKIVGGNRVASYESQAFRQTTCPAAINTYYNPATVKCHDFDPGAGTDATYGFSVAGDLRLRYTLGWNEPQYGISTDYDLCLLTNANAFIDCAEDNNLTTEKAFEAYFTSGAVNGTFNWVVVRRTGNSPRFKLISHRSGLTAVDYATSTGTDVVGPTIFGHNASRPGATVAAVPYNNSGALEDFSSWGPATYCWGPVVGTSPAAATLCQTATVDMTATDGGQNSFFGSLVGGIWRFYGTSAAAPHTAAVAALMQQWEPCLTPAQIIDVLKTTGRPVGATPVDGAGGGLVDAEAALRRAAAVGKCDGQPPAVTVSGANANWLRVPTATLQVAATDPHFVTDLACTEGTVSAATGLGTASASAIVTVAGDGQRTVSCRGTDLEGNVGSAGSANAAVVKIDATPPVVTCRPDAFLVGEAGAVVADVSDATSGPATATVSAPAVTTSIGTFSVPLTGSDVSGNSATASCAYSVSAVPVISGAAKAKVGKKKKYTAKGFPATASVKWKVTRGAKKVAKKTSRTSTSGTSSIKVKFSKKGRYVVRATSGAVTARKVVRVK